MQLFPIFTDLLDRQVLVIGGGEIAERKINLLLSANARVHVVCKTANTTVQQWAEEHRLQLTLRPYHPTDLDSVWMVIAATDDQALNQQISADAASRKVFANVVDNAALSSFQVPAIVDRSPIVVAISSAGAAPMVARRIRAQIESLVDQSISGVAQLLQHYRARIKAAHPMMKARRAFYDWVIDGPVARAIKAQRNDEAAHLLEAELDAPQSAAPGEVILVGAGPGDPGLLTLHALRALNLADVILYDRLVDPAILELARRDATQINVGKRVGEDHHATQTRIHQLMLRYAGQEGQTVVRLKGGDAFIFGRGGEEIEVLRAHNIRYQIVPGITAALACAAYSGIPLTHREHAQSVQFVTAHRKADHSIEEWQSLLDPTQTLVVYMGLKQIVSFAEALRENGRVASTPCALIENGSRPNQRTLISDLAHVAKHAQHHAFASPSLLVIGPVAALGVSLQWYGEVIDEYSNRYVVAAPSPTLLPTGEILAA